MPLPPKTVALLLPGFPANEAETSCLPMQQEFIRQLKEQYPAFTFVILSSQYPAVRRHYTWNGFQVISHGNKFRFVKRFAWRSMYATLQRLHRQAPLHSILSFWYGECALAGKKFSEAYSVPHFCWLMGQDARSSNHFPRRISLPPGSIIALSDFLQEEFERHHHIRASHVVYPGTRPTGSRAIAKKDIDLLAAGSLIPLKQYEVFIDIVADLTMYYPSLRAVLVGSGREEKMLREKTHRLGIADNLRFTGELPHEEVQRYMQRSKIFLHPSSYEGFGMVCIEALAAGCQVISFCKPVRKAVSKWHIAGDKSAMKIKAMDLLAETPDITPVIFRSMKETVADIGAILLEKRQQQPAGLFQGNNT